MIPPESGPFLFDTSAESWFGRNRNTEEWLRRYVIRHKIFVSSVTVVERIRGYALLWRQASEHDRLLIDQRRTAYLARLGEVKVVDLPTAMAAAELMAAMPIPPTPPRRTHRLAESKQDRLVRWRFDCLIGATAGVAGLPLVHNNPEDFEAIRSAIDSCRERFPGLEPLKLIHCLSLL